MVDTPASPGGAPARPANPNAMSVEVSDGAVRSDSVHTTGKGQQTTSERPSGGSVTVGGSPDDKPAPAVPEADTGAAPVGEEPDSGQPDGDDPASTDAVSHDDLGDYLPDDPEVATKFDQRYFTDEGKLNVNALSAEWATTQKDGAGGKLNEGTYKYLEDRLGIPRSEVDLIGKGLEAQRREDLNTFHAGAGGKDRYDAAIEWGRSGGYTKDQQARFNEMLSKGGQDAEDARDALMGRFSKAKFKENKAADRRGPPGAPDARRPANAKRDATRGGSSGSGGPEGFSSREEASKAFRAIAKNDTTARSAWNRRMAASPPHVKG